MTGRPAVRASGQNRRKNGVVLGFSFRGMVGQYGQHLINHQFVSALETRKGRTRFLAISSSTGYLRMGVECILSTNCQRLWACDPRSPLTMMVPHIRIGHRISSGGQNGRRRIGLRWKCSSRSLVPRPRDGVGQFVPPIRGRHQTHVELKWGVSHGRRATGRAGGGQCPMP